MLAKLRGRYEQHGIKLGSNVEGAVDGLCRAIVDLKTRLRDAKAERDKLRTQVENDVVREAVRAKGKNANRDRLVKRYQRASTDDLLEDLEDYRAEAAERLPGTRRTTDSTPDPVVLFPAAPLESYQS